MAHIVKNETARVAFAEREAREAIEEIDRHLEARGEALRAKASSKEQFFAICRGDDEFRRLVLERVAVEVWRKSNIEDDCIATVNDDGTLSWSLPQFAGKADLRRKS
jgi:hypothetical protein